MYNAAISSTVLSATGWRKEGGKKSQETRQSKRELNGSLKNKCQGASGNLTGCKVTSAIVIKKTG